MIQFYGVEQGLIFIQVCREFHGVLGLLFNFMGGGVFLRFRIGLGVVAKPRVLRCRLSDLGAGLWGSGFMSEALGFQALRATRPAD